MVNSESDFNENFNRKTKKTLVKIIVQKAFKEIFLP